MAYRYGLRLSDIKKLTLENIDWNLKTITIIQSKNKREITLPLLPDVYSAIIDYIQNARPATTERYVIVNSKGNYFGTNNFYDEIQKILQKANLNILNKKKGIHSLRHSLASRLLKENIPLPIISKVLDHANKSTTTIYTKIDENKLKQCCLSIEVTIDE